MRYDLPMTNHNEIQCRHCHQLIGLEGDRWVLLEIGGTYDICDANPTGHHHVPAGQLRRLKEKS